jgi:hypothetical protein
MSPDSSQLATKLCAERLQPKEFSLHQEINWNVCQMSESKGNQLFILGEPGIGDKL